MGSLHNKHKTLKLEGGYCAWKNTKVVMMWERIGVEENQYKHISVLENDMKVSSFLMEEQINYYCFLLFSFIC